MRKFLTIIILLLAISAAVVAPLAEINKASRPQRLNSFVFFPSKYPSGNWSPKDLKFVDIYFESEDKTLLHGWYCPCDTPVANVLVLHGNAGNISTRRELIRLLQKANVAIFIFDYRGYGRSSGSLSIEGAIKDANAARVKFSELSNVALSDIMLFGESLGGAFAIAIGADNPPKAMILHSTFSSLRDVADIHYPDRSSMVPSSMLNSTETIGRYHGPLLLSHGEKDQTIPYSLASKLFSAANEPKQFVSLANSDHNDAWDDNYESKLLAFIARWATPNKQRPTR